MNITIGIYSFISGNVMIKVPFEIIKETEKCYFTKGSRFLKENIGKPILKSATAYPYIELIMVDANEETLREELSKWFTKKACQISRIKCVFYLISKNPELNYQTERNKRKRRFKYDLLKVRKINGSSLRRHVSRLL